MRRLALGKIPIDILTSTVLRLTGAGSDKIATPASAGVDFAAVKLGRRFLVVSADPITGVSEEIGSYAVKVSANDVATSGNRAQFAESVVLLPEGSSRADLERIAEQIHEAAKESGMAILGGHTEVTPGLGRPIVMVTAFSVVDSYVTSGGAKVGDTILMTKTAGLEGTVELATEQRFPPGALAASTLKSARAMTKQIDISTEAVAAFGTGRVHAMHDCTEGGVLGAVFEMSLASGLGFLLSEKSVPVAPETKAICENLSIDPLRLVGSGALLVSVKQGAEARVERALRPICKVTRIGQFRKGPKAMLMSDGHEQAIEEAPQDELWRVLSRSGRGGHRL